MKILDRLPISGERTSLRFGTRNVTIHTNQIIVWMSVTLSGTLKPEASAPRFPRCSILAVTSLSRCRTGTCATGPN